MVGEYKITDDKKLDQAIDTNDKKLVVIREKMKESDKKMKFLTEAVKLINIMEKNQKYSKKKLLTNPRKVKGFNIIGKRKTYKNGN